MSTAIIAGNGLRYWAAPSVLDSPWCQIADDGQGRHGRTHAVVEYDGRVRPGSSTEVMGDLRGDGL